jgi:Fungal specific transcription factor domain
LQASLSEPAVLHAVLALSSVHRGGILNGDRQEQSNSIPDKLEQFTLQHYVKAISHLRPHFSAKDRASFRVALIVCIIFVSLDFLRGHFTTAQIHLQNGLKLLGETQSLSDRNDGLLLLRPCREAIDDWIVEAFSRLHIQVELFKQLYQHPCLLLQAAEPGPPAPMFCSFKEAWHEMERLMNKIFHLTKQAREHEAECTSLRHPLALLGHQQRVRTELARWLDTYEASREALRGQESLEEEKAYQILCIYHTMVTIMADMCLCPSDEGVFDSHTNQFVHLIRQLADLWAISSTIFPFRAPPGHLINMSRSIVDMAWIPPLYYAAVKCRVHRIRLQAIRLLESTFHREGIWDARIAACVSRKVMEIEERDYYKDVDTADDFPLSSSPRPRDLSLPPLPESYRIRDVEVVLSGDPMNKVLLLCRQRQDGMDCKVRIGEYHVPSQRWMDVDG